MKKIVALMGFACLLTGASFASLYEDSTSDINVLRSFGHSEAALRLVDLVNSHGNESYVRYYQPKKHKGFGKPYTILKEWFDPIQDDGLFGEHQIHYSNSWNLGAKEPEYTKVLLPKTNIENL